MQERIDRSVAAAALVALLAVLAVELVAVAATYGDAGNKISRRMQPDTSGVGNFLMTLRSLGAH